MMPISIAKRPSKSHFVRPLAWYASLCAALPLATHVPVALADDQAQTTTAPAQTQTSAAPAATGLQEVVVTATRREENLSKVPISITAMTSQDMEVRGIKSIDDIARFTPGLNIDQNGTNAISIRGISSSGGSGTTGIYIDDTPIQMRALAFNPDEALPSIFDMDRVEVLRGPQGTLFGAGSEGGTVRYITTAPSLTTISELGRAEVDYTQFGAPSYEAGAAIGGPLIDGTLGARVTLWYRKDGGWIDMVNPSDPGQVVDANANHDETYMARVAFLWEVSGNWSVSPSMLFQKRDAHQGDSYWPIYSSGSNFVNADPEVRGEPDTYYLPSIKVRGDLGAVTFISDTSFYHRKEQTGYEGTEYNLSFYQSLAGLGDSLMGANGLTFPPGLDNYRSPASVDNAQQNMTQEFRLQSSDPNARLVWTTGIFLSINNQSYLEQIHDPMVDQFFQALGYTPNGVPGSGGTNPNTGLAAFYDQYSNPLGYQTPGQGLNPLGIDPYDSYYLMTHAKDEQEAIFAEGTYAITDALKATVGLRESHTEFSIDSVTGGPQLFNTTTTRYASSDNNSFTPKVSLAWQMDPDNMLYATYAKGFRPGGGDNPLPPAACQLPSTSQTPSTYQSDTVDSYEIGAKDNIDNRFRISSSVYYIRWNNIQQQITVPICEISYITNLGQAVAKGADMQIEWLPVDPLTVELSMGYTDARFTQTTLSPFANPGNANCASTGGYCQIAKDGDAIEGESGYANPPFTAALGLEYAFGVAGYDTSLRMDYEYQAHAKWPTPSLDGSSFGTYQEPLQLPSNSTINLRYTVHVGDLLVEPFINNLTDSQSFTGYESQDGTGLIRAATFRPRTFGVTLTYKR